MSTCLNYFVYLNFPFIQCWRDVISTIGLNERFSSQEGVFGMIKSQPRKGSICDKASTEQMVFYVFNRTYLFVYDATWK